MSEKPLFSDYGSPNIVIIPTMSFSEGKNPPAKKSKLDFATDTTVKMAATSDDPVLKASTQPINLSETDTSLNVQPEEKQKMNINKPAVPQLPVCNTLENSKSTAMPHSGLDDSSTAKPILEAPHINMHLSNNIATPMTATAPTLPTNPGFPEYNLPDAQPTLNFPQPLQPEVQSMYHHTIHSTPILPPQPNYPAYNMSTSLQYYPTTPTKDEPMYNYIAPVQHPNIYTYNTYQSTYCGMPTTSSMCGSCPNQIWPHYGVPTVMAPVTHNAGAMYPEYPQNKPAPEKEFNIEERWAEYLKMNQSSKKSIKINLLSNKTNKRSSSQDQSAKEFSNSNMERDAPNNDYSSKKQKEHSVKFQNEMQARAEHNYDIEMLQRTSSNNNINEKQREHTSLRQKKSQNDYYDIEPEKDKRFISPDKNTTNSKNKYEDKKSKNTTSNNNNINEKQREHTSLKQKKAQNDYYDIEPEKDKRFISPDKNTTNSKNKYEDKKSKNTTSNHNNNINEKQREHTSLKQKKSQNDYYDIEPEKDKRFISPDKNTTNSKNKHEDETSKHTTNSKNKHEDETSKNTTEDQYPSLIRDFSNKIFNALEFKNKLSGTRSLSLKRPKDKSEEAGDKYRVRTNKNVTSNHGSKLKEKTSRSSRTPEDKARSDKKHKKTEISSKTKSNQEVVTKSLKRTKTSISEDELEIKRQKTSEKDLTKPKVKSKVEKIRVRSPSPSYSKSDDVLSKKQMKIKNGVEVELHHNLNTSEKLDLRTSLSRQNLSQYFSKIRNKDKLFENVSRKKDNLIISIPNAEQIIPASEDNQPKTKKGKNKKRKKLKLVINVVCDDSSDSSDEDEEDNKQTTLEDLSFLDDFNIDEIVDSLSKENKNNSMTQMVTEENDSDASTVHLEELSDFEYNNTTVLELKPEVKEETTKTQIIDNRESTKLIEDEHIDASQRNLYSPTMKETLIPLNEIKQEAVCEAQNEFENSAVPDSDARKQDSNTTDVINETITFWKTIKQESRDEPPEESYTKNVTAAVDEPQNHLPEMCIKEEPNENIETRVVINEPMELVEAPINVLNEVTTSIEFKTEPKDTAEISDVLENSITSQNDKSYTDEDTPINIETVPEEISSINYSNIDETPVLNIANENTTDESDVVEQNCDNIAKTTEISTKMKETEDIVREIPTDLNELIVSQNSDDEMEPIKPSTSTNNVQDAIAVLLNSIRNSLPKVPDNTSTMKEVEPIFEKLPEVAQDSIQKLSDVTCIQSEIPIDCNNTLESAEMKTELEENHTDAEEMFLNDVIDISVRNDFSENSNDSGLHSFKELNNKSEKPLANDGANAHKNVSIMDETQESTNSVLENDNNEGFESDEKGKITNVDCKTSDMKTAISEDSQNKEIIKPNNASVKLSSQSPTRIKTKPHIVENLKEGDKHCIEQLEKRMLSYLKQPYTIAKIIRRGKFSNIYQCKDFKGKKFAVKLLGPNCDRYQKGCLKENMIMDMQKDIPKENLNFVYIIDGFALGARWCFLMEYYPKTVKEALEENEKPFHINIVQHLSQQLVAAVTVLRHNCILHTDIKPSHILLNSTNDRLKLCGFDEAQYCYKLTIRPNYGTVNYRAPEVILGFSAEYSMDVWSTALVMFEMATGRQLLPGHFNNDILYKQICTFGSVPFNMLRQSKFADKHFSGNCFKRAFGPKHNLKFSFINQAHFYHNHILQSTIRSTYYQLWADGVPKKVQLIELRKLGQFTRLLEQMLVMDPNFRLPIEFVFANPFLFEASD